MNTVSAHLLCWHSNRQKRFFGGVAFKFEPNMTIIIKNLAQKVDFCAKWHNNQDWRSKCADTVFKVQNLVLFEFSLPGCGNR